MQNEKAKLVVAKYRRGTTTLFPSLKDGLPSTESIKLHLGEGLPRFLRDGTEIVTLMIGSDEDVALIIKKRGKKKKNHKLELGRGKMSKINQEMRQR